MTQGEGRDAELIGAMACSLLPCASKEACYGELVKHSTFVSLSQHSPLAPALAMVRRSAEQMLAASVQLGLTLVPLTSPQYPRLLRQSSHPPFMLYVLSDQEEFSIPDRALGIVGTRVAPIDVCTQTTLISYELARAGVTVVSGLALGIDGAAHRGALQAGGAFPTVAVLAHGLDRVYPRAHQALLGRIMEAGGAIISEYAPGIQPLKHHFLERNRIIAALSRGVVVVQAGERSGSLVTATYALDYGRDVFVLDGYLDSVEYAGSRKLCEDGARVVRSANDVLSEYPELVARHEDGERARSDAAFEWVILSVEEFTSSTKGGSVELLTCELDGDVVRLPGNRVAVRRPPLPVTEQS